MADSEHAALDRETENAPSEHAPLLGAVETASRTRLTGWAYDSAAPGAHVPLLITAGDVLLARVLADRPRADLRAASIGDGTHGFDVVLRGLALHERHQIAVQRESDGAHLGGSPVVLAPVERFDDAFRAQCAAVLGEAANASEITERLHFLAEQAEALLSALGERRSARRQRAALQQIKWRWGGDVSQPPAPLPPRALVIDEWVPALGRDAGSNAILSHMGALRRLGFEVNFVAANMAADIAGVLEASGITCCQAPWHGSVEEVLRREAGAFDLVYLHRASVAARYLGLGGFHQPKARLVYSVADLHFLRVARQADVQARPELRGLARRFQAVELQAAAAAHAVITHSAYEAQLLRQCLPAARVHVVPWAVPVCPSAAPWAERAGVAFIGHFGHAPNLDAAHWLLDAIMPQVWGTHPALGCVLAGSDMPPALRKPPPGVAVMAEVENLATVFDRVRLTVAPMAFGAGVKGKVLDSLAAGIPCVCSPIAAEGLDLPPILQSLIAADAPGIAASVVRLHEDETLHQACREAALAYIAANFSERRLDTLMHDVAALPAAHLGSKYQDEA
jgi:glycosyltransferase involved in cell wall biosynthesis